MITSRDFDVLMELLKGKRNNEIGQALNMSPRTVKQHLNRMAFRLGMPGADRVKLAVEAYYQMHPEKRI